MAFDYYSAETAECYDVLFDDDGNLRKKFWDSCHGQYGNLTTDFHFLERIEIDAKYKGNGHVGVATRIYLENFANKDDVVYFKAFPLQYEAKICDDKHYKRSFNGTFKTCQIKLCNYYETLGFRRIKQSPHFFFVVDAFLGSSTK